MFSSFKNLLYNPGKNRQEEIEMTAILEEIRRKVFNLSYVT